MKSKITNEEYATIPISIRIGTDSTEFFIESPINSARSSGDNGFMGVKMFFIAQSQRLLSQTIAPEFGLLRV